jgi:hypothetical protein
MQKIILLPFLCIVLGLSAQNTKKGFKLLEKAEYEKSNEVFRQVLAEHDQDLPASFGLSMIFGDDRSPLFNLLEAWSFAVKVKPNLEKFTPEELEMIGEYFHETEVRPRNIPVKKKIEYALETMEAKLIKYIREENNLDMVYAVIEKFPDFRYHENVMHIRNQLEFRKYEKMNTLEGYLEFIRKFPDAAQLDKAIKYRNQLAFDKARQANTVEAYQEYLKNYPQASECSMAIKMLYGAAFQRARQLNTISAYDDFMSAYPDALELADARQLQKQLLYDYAKKIQTIEAYNEFIRKYPEGQQYIDIFNLRSLDKGMKFISSQTFPSNNLQWARSFGEEDSRELSACMAVDSSNAYIAGGTVVRHDTGTSDAWVIKLGTDGKMIWNKFVGEEHNDELQILDVSHLNEILGIGYTWLGADSSSRESWIFKLGPDGQKQWSKKLGNLQVNCLLTAGPGKIFLGGFEINDTSGVKNYSVMTLNDNGKKLWSRTYTGTGEIENLSVLPDRNILMTGNHWRAKVDPRGYLIWESAFGASDSIFNAVSFPRGEIIYLGVRNKISPVLIKTGPDNKILYEKEISFPDILISAGTLFSAGPGTAIALMDFQTGQRICWINTIQGEIQKTIQIPSGMKVTGIKKDMEGNLILAAFSGEILLIKNSGIGF